MAVDHVHALAVAADEPAAVHLHFGSFADQPELDRVPEQTPELLQHFRIFNRRTDATVVLQKIREHPMSMHWHMPEDIVKNVGLWRVLDRLSAAEPSRCW